MVLVLKLSVPKNSAKNSSDVIFRINEFDFAGVIDDERLEESTNA